MFTDEHDIDRALTAALDVQPSTGFEAGVQRRIQAARSEPARRGIPAWLAAAAALTLLAWGGFLLRDRTVEPAPQRAEHVPPAAPAPAPEATSPGHGRPPAASRVTPERPPRRAAVVVAAPRVARRAEPDVIVPANQRALIERLLRDVQAGRVELAEWGAAVAPAPAALTVSPILVNSLTVPSLEPDGQQAPPAKGLK